MNTILLLRKTTAIYEKYRAITEASGDNYNLFRVIGLTSDEVKIHSAFLANILNPQANHGQKNVFLSLFTQEFNVTDFDCDSAKVTVEKYIGEKTEIDGGRIDIDIVDKNGYHIIIENKIYAKDQDNQLIRYSRYGKHRCRKHILFYLTLNGDMPDEDISCKNENHSMALQEGEDFHLLSYNTDIIRWLELCREKSVTKPLLRESISHYINLIKYLTNQSINQNMNQEIIKEFLRPENVGNLANIKECLLLTQIELQTQFWSLLIDRLKSEGFEVSENSYNKQNIEDYYMKSQNNKYYGIEIKFASRDNTSFRYGIRIDHHIYGGFTIREGENKENCVNNKSEYKEYVEIVKNIDTNYQNSEWWLGWKTLTPRLNFKNIDEETSSNLAKLNETVNSMVNCIQEEINIFKTEL